MPNSKAGSKATSTVRFRLTEAPVAAMAEYAEPWPAFDWLVAVTCRLKGIRDATIPWSGPEPTMSHALHGFGTLGQGFPLGWVDGQVMVFVKFMLVIIEPLIAVG